MNRWKRWISALLGVSGRDAVTEREEDKKAFHYLSIYRGASPCQENALIHSLGTAAALCRELARTSCAEMEVSFYGGERASYLRKQTEQMLPEFAEAFASVLGVGCGMVRLYPKSGGGIGVDFVQPDHYLVLNRKEDGAAKEVCFFEDCTEAGAHYLRCERHECGEDGKYSIENRLYLEQGGEYREAPLSTVKRFASYPTHCEMRGMRSALFLEWRHGAGEPIYQSALSLLADADRQYERLLWEFEGGELAVDVSEDAFRCDGDGTCILPAGKDRLFRMNILDSSSENAEGMRVFSPTLRDESLIRGLNRILMAVEDSIGIAHGTVSDPDTVARTATEIRSMRQRTYLTVAGLRHEVREILGRILSSMDLLCTLYRLAPEGRYECKVRFDDGVLIDSEKEREADRADAEAGLMTREEYRKKWLEGGRKNEFDYA